MKGGKREGAGRPVGTTKPETAPVAIRLTAAHRAKLKELGGVIWLRRMLDKHRARLKQAGAHLPRS